MHNHILIILVFQC